MVPPVRNFSLHCTWMLGVWSVTIGHPVTSITKSISYWDRAATDVGAYQPNHIDIFDGPWSSITVQNTNENVDVHRGTHFILPLVVCLADSQEIRLSTKPISVGEERRRKWTHIQHVPAITFFTAAACSRSRCLHCLQPHRANLSDNSDCLFYYSGFIYLEHAGIGKCMETW